MRPSRSVTYTGLTVSAVLAAIYMAVTLASLLLVGLGTTKSLRATLLGLEWNTVVGLEIGLIVIAALGFAVGVAVAAASRAVRRRGEEGTAEPSGVVARSWPVRLLVLLALVPLTLLVLDGLARVGAPVTTVNPPAAQRPADGRRRPVNAGRAVNTAFREAEPSFTGNGRTMYFNGHGLDISVSRLVGDFEAGDWSRPEVIGPPISTEYEDVEPVINAAGDKLYFTSTRPKGALKNVPFLSPFVNVLRVINTVAEGRLGSTFFGGAGLPEVWVSYRVKGRWSEPRSINDIPGEPHINTEFADHCPFFSADGTEAFWTSTRPGGFGDDDIWTSRRADGGWTEPENLGPNVNGPESEHTSIPAPDGRSLYITATRPGGFGDEDIFITTREPSGEWGPLVNLGPLVNGRGDDRCPAWTPDFRYFLFDSVRRGGLGSRDLWWVFFDRVPGHPNR